MDEGGSPWGEEWVWNGLLNRQCRREARELEGAKRAAAHVQAALTATMPRQGHIDSRSSRAECLAVTLRLRSHARARRQLGFRLSAGLTERTLSSDQEPWRGRSKVFSKVEDVQGRRSLERVLVSWVPENDESEEKGQEGYYRRRRSWMLPRVLPKFVRLLAKAIWGARGGATSSSSVIRAPLRGGRKQLGLPEHQPAPSFADDKGRSGFFHSGPELSNSPGGDG